MIAIIFLLSQYPFGQNKVQYEQIPWKTTESEHFLLYYQEGSEALAGFSIQVLESTYVYLKRRFTYKEKENEKKIVVIVYNSYNKFEETNVVLERLPESVGGFTESFKNRVVLPFDGDWSKFRHVLSHELVHVFQNRIWYGRGLQSFNKRLTMNIPLWFIEGMAEYFSLGWDPESDGFMRDLVINENVIPLKKLEYYGGSVIYKEGQSVFRFIDSRYGEQKIGEIVNAIRVTKSLDKALQKVLGINLEKLDELWQKELKKEYWPLLEDRVFVEDFTRRLTDHRRKKNYLNYAPALSPDGSKIVYYTDSKGDIEIRVLSPIDQKDLGRIIKGGRGRKFESLHILEGHIGFSSGGDSICFVSKELGKDILYIYSFSKGKIVGRYVPGPDRIMWPDFSPDGKKVVFTGVSDGIPDIYLFNLKNKSLENLTNDFYSDLNPSFWGDRILFVSSRPSGGVWDYDRYDLYVIDGGVIKKLLSFEGSVYSPEGKDSLIYFLSYRDGSRNLYVFNVKTGEIMQLTRLLEPIESFSVDREGKNMVLSCYTNGGWDIFFIDSLEGCPRTPPSPCKEFDILKFFILPNVTVAGKKAPINLSVDYVQSYVVYDTYYGWWGELLIAVSDALGNHRIYGYFDNTDILSSNFNLTYLYLPRRIDYGLSISKYSVGYWSMYADDLYYNEGTFLSLGTLVRYPFDTFSRIDFYTTSIYLGIDNYLLRGDTLYYQGSEKEYAVFGELWYVRDNTLWLGYAPVKGFRGYVRFLSSLVNGENFWDLKAFETDLRWYYYFGNQWSFAARSYFFSSWGRESELLGSLGIGDAGGVRSYDYYEQFGTKAGIIKMELRFPLIKRLEMGFPPITIGGIKGAFFLDMGGATYSMHDYTPISIENGFPRLVDALGSIGIEAKVNLGITDLNFYVAKRTDLQSILPGTYCSIYLGYAF